MFRLCLFLTAVWLAAGDTLYFQPKGVVKDIICDDKKTSCPDDSTCCSLPTGGYGCCPLPKAVCCSDHQHCCPAGHKCDVSAGKCLTASGVSRPWVLKKPAKSLSAKAQVIICPGGEYQCPNGQTCCQQDGGGYACCPFNKATCCSDHSHCCPQDYKCDLSHGTCVKSGAAKVLLGKVQEAASVAAGATTAKKPQHKLNLQTAVKITCPDKSTCPDGTTCCQMATGQYGCCPMPNAVCCSDHIHCCPEGQTCDVSAGTCNAANGVTTILHRKFPATAAEESSVTCPGGSTECPSGSTCCRIAGGKYACCPLPNAVCCQDELHCCPQGYTCDKGNCVKGNLAITWMVKTPSKPKAAVTTKMVCPDKKSTCPSGHTCCQVASGGYGCCPLPNAACCADKEHCCPVGYLCDPQSALCILSTVSVPFSMKQPARKMLDVSTPKPLKDIICPDQRSMCPDQATCCLMASGSWGCCPMPNAICCADHQHCCPEGTKCDVAAGMCTSSTSSLSISHTRLTPRSKVNIAMATNEATPKQSVTIVKCEDETECPDGDTCCVMSSGKYACCPHNDATCCPDKQHCCPKGYTCGEKADECNKGSMSVSAIFIARLLSKRPAQPQMQVMDIKCADRETSCPNGNTCCAMQAGGYGCCALPNAVCCASGSCCPSGHKCDASGTQCTVSIPWMKKKASSPTITGEEKTLPQACPNTRFTCAAGNTCCQTKGDNWGCCASPDAVCCKNGPYCCPKGLTCSDQPGQCLPATGSESTKHAATFLQRAAKGGHILY